MLLIQVMLMVVVVVVIVMVVVVLGLLLNLPQDIYIHLNGDSTGKGPDVGAGVMDGDGDMTSYVTTEGPSESCVSLKHKIKDIEKNVESEKLEVKGLEEKVRKIKV